MKSVNGSVRVFVLAALVAVGCGGVTVAEDDGGAGASGAAGHVGAAGSSAAGSSGGAGGAAGAAAAGAPGIAGAGAGGSGGSGGSVSPTAGTSGTAGAGVAGSGGAAGSGAAGAGGDGVPWCKKEWPSDWLPACDGVEPTFYACGGPGTNNPARFKTVPEFGALECGRCGQSGKSLYGCMAGYKSTKYGTVSCSNPTRFCVKDCAAECP